MTRGKLVIVLPNGGFTTREYNGDMYMNQGEYGPSAPISPGDIARKEIDVPTDYDSFVEMVRKFTTYYYGPEYGNANLSPEDLEIECEVHPLHQSSIDSDLNIHFAEYFPYWFSDFIYLKNQSGKQITVFTREGDDVILDNGQSEVFYFGRKYEAPKDED